MKEERYFEYAHVGDKSLRFSYHSESTLILHYHQQQWLFYCVIFRKDEGEGEIFGIKFHSAYTRTNTLTKCIPHASIAKIYALNLYSCIQSTERKNIQSQ